ncbi:hypothetical protein [Streptomyces roseolus]|uniref:hypothetical protein n=1 Tax=Streptomyces roseolus TaxID=67358 RepID=UPI00365BD78E
MTDDLERAGAAGLAALSGPARAWHLGVASHEKPLLHRTGPRRYDDCGVEATGRPGD